MVEPARSCLKFRDKDSGKLYFVSVAHYAAPAGVPPDAATADLAVTDGEAAWQASALGAANLKGQAAGKVAHFLSALTDLEPAKLPYNVDFVEKDGNLVTRVWWQLSPTDPKIIISASLAPAGHAQPVLCSMLELLVDNLGALRGLSEGLLVQLKEYEKQCSRSQELVDKYVKTKEVQDRETNIKVAVLLNSKKQKLRDLQKQLTEAQEEIRLLKEGGFVAAEPPAEPMDSDGGDEGAAGPSRAAAARAFGEAGGGAEHGSEDEESDEEGAMASGGSPQREWD